MIVDSTIHIAHVGAHGANHSPWVHLNLQDLSPPGHDLLTVLHDPKGRNARIDAWATALRTFDKGLLYVKGLRDGAPLAGVSIEGEQVVPVPHDRSMMHPSDSLRSRGLAIERVLWQIGWVMGVPRVIPYGSAQVLAAWLNNPNNVHGIQSVTWYGWHRSSGGYLRGVPPCQSFYGWKSPWLIVAALDRHAASGRISKSTPLVVFIAPTDTNASMQAASVRNHPLPCRLVSWHKADKADTATAGVDAVKKLAADTGLTLGCEVANG